MSEQTHYVQTCRLIGWQVFNERLLYLPVANCGTRHTAGHLLSVISHHI